MSHTDENSLTRRELLKTAGKATAVVVASPLVELAFGGDGVLSAQALPAAFNAAAGPDRVVMRHGKTYLNAWTGVGQQPRRQRLRGGPPPQAAPPPPPEQRRFVVTRPYAVTGPFWTSRVKALITSWIPYCVDQCNRTGIPAGRGDGGIDNFVEAAKALRGEPYAAHKGYIFSNAWVHQTVESICLALMIDPQGDQEIIAAQKKLRASLEDWIPKILAAQHPDGYLQTAFTLRNAPRPDQPAAGGRGPWRERWSVSHRANHEGYVAGYFIEAAINHYVMSEGKDLRLYHAAKKLCDCWADHIGPAPKQAWYDGHQQMEQGLVRFGRFVNEIERKPGSKTGPGDRYIALAKFLLDCRKDGTEYDQSHLPVQQQYEAVGHAVRAVYTYSGMADVAVETHDVDYQSATKSIWDNLVNKKYYLTGGVGSGETAEGFGPDYSLRNDGYCEACSSCGEIFFQWKLHLAYHDAQYADLYEQTMYNAVYGSLDLLGKRFYYDNPLDENTARYPWHNCPCCVGNIARTMLMLPTWAYSRSADAVYVNLFAGMRVNLGEVAGTEVEIVQETNYPWDGTVKLTVNPRAPKAFAVRIRVPKRDVSTLYRATPNGDGITKMTVNGTVFKAPEARGYAEISRRWKAGDTIELTLPMPVQRVYGSDKIISGDSRPSPVKDKVALRMGPLVYNIEKVDQDITGVLPPEAPLVSEWRADLLGGVNVIKGTFANGAPMTAIPNPMRYNRHPPAPQPSPGPPPAPGTPRPEPPPPESIVWIREK